jgi:hypothetical protein
MFPNIPHYLLDLAFRPDEWPMVFYGLDTVELNETRTGNAMEGFPRRIRYEMEMKFFHGWSQ